jgi:hypothetical protein
MLPGKHNRRVSSLLESLGQAIEISRRRKIRSNSIELSFDFMEPP